ncbi:MAG: FAD:protein FMN transferase [Bacteroides sp.]|nr:FAD:protein FMN transferase [Bacteroides sp.]
MKRHRILRHIKNYHYLLILVSLFGIFAESCRKSNDYIRIEGGVWNTLWHVTYRGPQSLADSIPATLSSVGGSLNVFDSTSVVSRVNRDEKVELDSHFVRVLEVSKIINRETNGAFDPTLGPLIRAWGFGPGHNVSPDTARVDSLLRLVGIGKTGVNGKYLSKRDPRIEFNFSAIAKGYGCDMIAAMFERNGVEDYLIEIGGEIRCGGKSPKGGEWRISVDKPEWSMTSANHESQEIISITNCGVATSGNYRNFIKDSGRTFGHTISATSGRPVATDVISATVVAPTAMEADGYATAFMAMGSETGLATARRLNLPIMLILSDSTVVTTPPFDKLTSHREQY